MESLDAQLAYIRKKADYILRKTWMIRRRLSLDRKRTFFKVYLQCLVDYIGPMAIVMGKSEEVGRLRRNLIRKALSLPGAFPTALVDELFQDRSERWRIRVSEMSNKGNWPGMREKIRMEELKLKKRFQENGKLFLRLRDIFSGEYCGVHEGERRSIAHCRRLRLLESEDQLTSWVKEDRWDCIRTFVDRAECCYGRGFGREENSD